jgi:hypothetical protein
MTSSTIPIPALRFDPHVDPRPENREGPAGPPQRRFQISFRPNGVVGWAMFGAPISAWTPREAIEKCSPQAFGRYRVVDLSAGGEQARLFRVHRGPNGCAISDV